MTSALSVHEHLDRIECTPLVRDLAEQVAALAPWIATDRDDLGYVGLKCTAEGQIAVYVNHNFVAFALDDQPAETHAERLAVRVHVKTPTSYVEVFEADLERGLDTERLLALAQEARTRNLARSGNAGRHAGSSNEARRPTCPVCFLELNARNECDDHGRQG